MLRNRLEFDSLAMHCISLTRFDTIWLIQPSCDTNHGGLVAEYDFNRKRNSEPIVSDVNHMQLRIDQLDARK